MLVVDASAVVELLLRTPKAATVGGHLKRSQVHAPELIGYETLSAIRGHVRGCRLTPGEGLGVMREFERIEANLELWPLLEIMSECAVELRENVTAYDASYVALAENLGCPLVTSDGRLARAVERRIDVTLV